MTNQTQIKSFILHLDSLEILNKLNDEQAGKLFKAIYSYQKNGNYQELDFALDLALNPFLNQFKRDKEKWETEIKKSSDKGKIGNLKRWHKEIYKRFMRQELTLDEAMSIATQSSRIVNDSQQSTPIPKSLKNKSDSKSESESESESKKESELKILKNNFEEFWQFYTPTTGKDGTFVSKGSKADASRAYDKAIKQFSHEKIMDCLRFYLTSCHKNSRFTKHASSWLNQSLKDNFEIEESVAIQSQPQPQPTKLTRDQQQDLINQQLEEKYAFNQNF